MNQRVVHILGIAPYESMKASMVDLAAEYPEIFLDVYVGDLEQGAEIVHRNLKRSYDIIISRGGTAELIKKSTTIPVIEISLSVYDILRAIKLAENCAGPYAIVGFPGITRNAHLLCDLLQYPLDIFTIHNKQDSETTLLSLKDKGYRMVICDMITNTTAKNLGMNTILITSGAESILNAFDEAIKLSHSFDSYKKDTLFLQKVLENQDQSSVVFDAGGKLFYSSVPFNNDSPLLHVLEKELNHTEGGNQRSFYKNINNMLYSIQSRKFSLEDETYTVFYFTAKTVPVLGSKYGLSYLNWEDAKELTYYSFFNMGDPFDELSRELLKISQSPYPVMISGEPGTEKKQAAGMIYSRSSFKNQPFVLIDFALVNDKTWNFLTNHYNSPFTDSGNTLFFHHLGALSPERQRQLLSNILDMNLHRQNRLIFSYTVTPNQSDYGFIKEYINRLSCLLLQVPPLREQSDSIPTFTSLYLNTLNLTLTKQIIGFHPEALQLVKQYSWPENYVQFKRILQELAVLTETPYIKAEHVKRLLSKEAPAPLLAADRPDHSSFQSGTGYLNLNQSLDNITRDIIRLSVEEAGGNQSAAAKKLGISRTTLWRYLK